jgi:hypothetical protein
MRTKFDIYVFIFILFNDVVLNKHFHILKSFNISTTFLLNVQARDIVKSRGTNLHRYQYLRVGGVFDLSSKSIQRQSDRSLILEYLFIYSNAHL